MERPDSAIFTLIICIGTNTWETLKCFLNLQHPNKHGCTCEGKAFSVHLFAFGELPRPNSTSPFCFSKPLPAWKGEGNVLSWLHGLPFMLLEKHLCISRSFCLGLLSHFSSCRPACFSSFSSCLCWEGSVVYITQEWDPPKVPQKGIHSSSGATSAGYDAGVRGKNCSMPYLHTYLLWSQAWLAGRRRREEG